MDLNLFVAFEALMETRNTARAGEILGVSQPAASAALGRLRAYFRDELLVMHGRQMFPTPFAEILLPQVQACLRSAESALTSSVQFVPEHADREFRIVASDYVVAAILAPLSRQLASTAPGLRFQFILADEHATEQLRRGQIDLLISPSEYALANVPTEPLYEETYVLVGAKDHEIFAEGVTIDAIFRYGHVAVAVGNHRSATVGDRQLAQLGYERRVEVVASSFTVLPWLLIGTQRLVLMHAKLARLMTKQFDIRYAVVPANLAPLQQVVQYHPTRMSDPGVRWLVEKIRAFATQDEPD
ncbi:LysR family transcriptional regulator [Novosphingobium sp. Leaf2]|uniref:LysR family transcriptional regulator n=1 Tax=Novosphingobium sp. Leaf2 TaxID=1735670 RepID=UPI0007149C5E|nr:LysR family transcriptional regulator [Novosphingobium sp. Leaf2]KQM14792.1 hypothetical protein ASE49_11575 [Novosphingobium sp. Leaf2]